MIGHNNVFGNVSKTKIGSSLIGLAGTIEAIAQAPGLSPSVLAWLHVAAVLCGAIGTALAGHGIRDAMEPPVEGNGSETK